MRSTTSPDLLAAVKAHGEACLKCCIQMNYPLSLNAKGSVRTFVRSVEEANGAAAWRLTHSGLAPGTKNRQSSLMQNIMMRATNPYQLAAKLTFFWTDDKSCFFCAARHPADFDGGPTAGAQVLASVSMTPRYPYHSGPALRSRVPSRPVSS